MTNDEKNLKLANYINQNLRFFQDRGYPLVEKVVISKEAFLNKEDLIAFYRHKDKGIYFQPEIEATENIKEYLEKRKKAYSTTNENHFFRHEFGHFYFHSLDESKYQKLRMSKFREINQNKIEKLVSKPATRNINKFLSEVSAGIIEKKEYLKVIMRLYYKYGGR